jgi:prepilin-type N-terminal cleavage/methylation domain-containing protein
VTSLAPNFSEKIGVLTPSPDWIAGCTHSVAMNARGFTLVETMFAIGILGVALTMLAQLFVIATESNVNSRRSSLASILAAQKIEQLRTLGDELAPSGVESLSADVDGACDFLDEYGRSMGGGSSPPDGAVYIRRWSVQPLAEDPDTFVLQVAVFPRSWRSGTDPAVPDARPLGGAQIVSAAGRRFR